MLAAVHVHLQCKVITSEQERSAYGIALGFFCSTMQYGKHSIIPIVWKISIIPTLLARSENAVRNESHVRPLLPHWIPSNALKIAIRFFEYITYAERIKKWHDQCIRDGGVGFPGFWFPCILSIMSSRDDCKMQENSSPPTSNLITVAFILVNVRSQWSEQINYGYLFRGKHHAY